MSEENESLELLWKQYALHVDLYKFYLDTTIKVNVFYYAVTGGILSYYFQNPGNGVARYALALPIATSLALGGIFWYGSNLVSVVRQEMFAIRDKLKFSTAPEFAVLTVFLRVMGSILVIVGVTLGWYLLSQRSQDAQSLAGVTPSRLGIVSSVGLQVLGTVLLALFSLFGIEIKANDKAYFEGVQSVGIRVAWYRAAQVGAALVVAGMVWAGALTLRSAG